MISQGSTTHRPAPISSTSQPWRKARVVSSISAASIARPVVVISLSMRDSEAKAANTLAAIMPVNSTA